MKKVLIVLIILMIMLTGCKKKSKEVLENKDKKVKETVKCDDIEKSFEIKFDTLGGNEIKSIRYSTDSSSLPVATREGYIFKGWYYDKDYKSQVETSKVSEIKIYEIKNLGNCIVGYNDITLYAKWEEDKTAKKVEYYCDGGYTLSGTKCSRTEVIGASVNESCPEGYRGIGEYQCHNESGKTSKDKLHCKEGSVGLEAFGECLTGPVEMTQDECNYYSYYWYNGICYGSRDLAYCPDGNYANQWGDYKNGVTYYCSMYSDGRDEWAKTFNTYACPDGYTLSGTSCTRTIVVDAKTR